MKLVCLETGLMRSNSYLLINEDENTAILVDCGGDGQEVILAARQRGIIIAAVLLTHGHADHIEGVARVVEEFGCSVYMHRYDADYPKRAECNLSARIYLQPKTYDFVPQMTEDGEQLDVAGFAVEVIHTPGHTMGSVCYRVGNILFTGDTLFRESVGNDFPPFGNLETEIESIRERLFSLGEDLVCYPGHGDSTTLSHEMKYNMYCRM